MNIKHVVIHELEKEQGKVGANLILFNSTVDHKGKTVIKLIKELNNRYKNRNETYGVFDNASPTIFHTSFEKFFKRQGEASFLDFTINSSTDLKSRIDSIAQAKGGYLIFAQYEYIKSFVSLFFVRNTTGVSFNRDANKNKFDIKNVQHIDFENLAMACRINLETYREKDIRYLSFISSKGDETSSYFTRWISSADLESNQEDTKQLYTLLQTIDPPINPKTNKPISRNELLQSVYSIIKTSPNRTVNIRHLSQTLYGDEDFLTTFIQKNDWVINGEFKAHPNTLKKFVYVKAKADDVEIAFPHTAYKSIVRFNEQNKSQIIITSADLAEKVRKIISGE